MSCPENVSTEKWLAKAKVRMMLSAPFHGSIVSQTEFKERNDLPTAATNGKDIFYNEQFVRGLSLPQLCYLLAHEADHMAMLHSFRMGKRDPKKWNYAADYSINTTTLQDLCREGVFEAIEGGLFDEKYKNWSSEKIYEDLNDEDIPEDTDCHVIAPNEDGEGNADGYMSDGELKELEEQAKRKILAAAETAKSMGKLPGDYSSLLDKIRNPRLDWKELFRRAVVGETPDDYTYRRPNRKLIGYGFYMPSVQKTSVGNIYVWRDTSGSVSDKENEALCAELKGIIEDVKPKAVHVIDCDTEVREVRTYNAGDTLDEIGRTGYGGTDPQPFFDYVEEHGEEVQAIVCLTDMGLYFDSLSLPTLGEVTWVSTVQNQNPGIGNYIEIEV
jgi:predicted metal-dependent peptidase